MMTGNQIAYVKAREEQRHNIAMEGETYRSNRAREDETHRANDLNYSASIYASQASMYNAQLNYNASVYASTLNAATQRYSIETQAKTAEENRIQNAVIENNKLGETVRHNMAEEASNFSKARASRTSSIGSFLNGVGGLAKAGVAIAGLLAG